MSTPPTSNVSHASRARSMRGVKDPGVNAVAAVVHSPEGIIEIGKGFDEGDRSEGFFAVERGMRGHVFEDGCLMQGALPLSATEKAPPGGDSFVYPLFQALRFRFRDHRADERGFIAGVPGDKCRSGRDKLLLEGRRQGRVDKDALHGNATLSGLIKGSRDKAFHGVVQVDAVVEDRRSVASQFEDDLLFARLGLECPTNFGGTGETEQLRRSSVVKRSAPSRVQGRMEKRALGQVRPAQNFADDEGTHGGEARGRSPSRYPPLAPAPLVSPPCP